MLLKAQSEMLGLLLGVRMLQLHTWQNLHLVHFYNQINDRFGELLFGMLTALNTILRDFNK
jgi:hypothetical protein